MKSLWNTLTALMGMVAIAGAQPGDAGKNRGKDRPGGDPRAERPGGERPGGERRGRGERRGPDAEGFLRNYDRNSDGGVTFAEMQVAEKLKNMSDAGKQRIFDHLDKNGDGKITREELPRMAAPRPPEAGGKRRDDKNGDGKISFEEFAASGRVKEAGEEARKKMFQRLDANGDGFLTAEDFRNRPEGSRPSDRRRPFLDPKTLGKLDADQDGALSFEEWRKNPRFKEFPEDRLQEWFKRMDRNEDGKLDPSDRPEGAPRRGPGGDRPEGRGPGPDGPPRRGPGARPNPGLGPGQGSDKPQRSPAIQ